MKRSSSNSVEVNEIWLAGAGHLVTVLVEHQVADDELRAAVLRGHPGAPQQRAQPQHDLFQAERLGDVVVATGGEAGDAVLYRVLCRQQQHRQLWILFAQFA